MSEEKPVKFNHYRAVFKSDHLGVADIEDMIAMGHDLIVTITHVTQHFPNDNPVKVAGKTGQFNIAHFKDKSIKDWVLNAGNTLLFKQLSGTVEVNLNLWPETTVQLYIDPTAKYAGEVTGGVRINPKMVKKEKQWLTPENTTVWKRAVEAYEKYGNLDAVLKTWKISQENIAIIESDPEAPTDGA